VNGRYGGVQDEFTYIVLVGRSVVDYVLMTEKKSKEFFRGVEIVSYMCSFISRIV